MNKKLAAALSGGAVLVLALSGCTDDDGDNKVNDWAKTFCDQAQPQIKKRANAEQAIISTAADGKPADIQAADSKAFQDLADVNNSLATAVKGGGTPPIDGGAKVQQDAVAELQATAKAYLALKKQVDGLDAKDQQKFADGLQGVADGLAKIEKMKQDAVKKLQSGDLGKAMAKEPGCQTVKGSSPPAGGSGSDSPSAPASPSGPASSKASAKAAPKPSVTVSAGKSSEQSSEL
ncbi:small secreted protein [Streptomyces sp. NBC_00322]|uniref:small secreted protein n=1 Tax=Streptomyces sp. NBC_00322 TaxID=2975712 RepID=UPI002E27EA94|nr:small secreted protein [Streptomyces sp. NBC_00322]